MRLVSLTLLILFGICTNAQKYFEMMQDPTASLSDTYAEYMNFVGDRNPYEVKGHKQFFRWYEEAVKAAHPHDNLEHLSKTFNDYVFQHRGNNSSSGNLRAGGNWQSFGPQNAPAGGHNGKIDGLSFHPTNPDIIYISGSCGLWRTLDGGANWEPISDNNAITRVQDVDIAPSNPDVIYYLAGGYYEYGAASLGVYKSTDAGLTWNITGFDYQSAGAGWGRTLLVDPNDENIVYVSASSGVFKSTDGMATFTQIHTSAPREMFFNPLNSNKIYMVYNSVQYSEDAGATWTVSTGLGPSTKSIAVTPADTSIVYAIAASAFSTEVYKSIDGGVSFTTQSTSPNILGYGTSGNPSSGQGAYCLALTVSPTDANKVFSGGIYVWTSDDGGLTWVSNGTISSTHADVQEFAWRGDTLWMGNDGGVFSSDDYGASWDWYQNMQTSMIYRIGLSEQNTDNFLTGWQDNGTAEYDGSAWTKIGGGDGMDCLIDYTDDDFRFISYQYGNGSVAQDGQNYNWAFSSNGSGINSQGHFRTRVKQSRNIRDEYYVGKDRLYKSEDRMVTWVSTGNIPYSSFWNKISTYDICETNSDYIYIETVAEIFRSSDAGQTWTDITAGVDVDSAYIQDIMVSPTDSLHVWVAMSGTNAVTKMYESFDGGDNWTNISAGLPNLPMQFLIYQKGTNDRIYVSCYAGIFHRDNDNPAWEEYGTGLPNALPAQMDIDYENGKFYTTTYGRGIWTNDLLLDTIAPVANFNAYGQKDCGFGNGEVVFLDLADNTPTSWQWSFPGGSPATSAMPNPFVEYPATGTYPIELIVTNAYGTDTMTMNLFVEKVTLPTPAAPVNQEGFETGLTIPAYMTVVNPDALIEWEVEPSLGAFGVSSQCVKIDNYQNGNSGNHDGLELGTYDFTQVQYSDFTVDVANKPYDATHVDTLALMASVDCGQSWTQVWSKTGNDLYIGTQYETNLFVPQAQDWQTFTISLNAYSGANRVSFKFENRSGEGNVLYLDNINLFSGNSNAPTSNYTSSSSSICEGDSIQFIDSSSDFPNSWNWDFEGGSPLVSTQSQEWVTYLNAGTYDVQLISSNLNGVDTLLNVDQVVVNPLPNAPINMVANQISTDPGHSYQWFWDGFIMTGSNSESITVTQGGYYWVEVTDVNGCTQLSDSVYMSLSGLSDFENQIKFYPNPVEDVLFVSVDLGEEINFDFVLQNALGQVLMHNVGAVNSGQTAIDLKGLAKGVYVVQLRNQAGETKVSRKIVVD